MRVPITAVVLALLVSLESAAPAGAQVVSVPTFPVAAHAFDVDVAAAYTGLYFLVAPQYAGGAVQLQRTYLGQWYPPYTVNFEGPVGSVALAAVQNGGFIAGWMFGFHNEIMARRLDVLGVPISTPFQVTQDELFTTGGVVVGGLAAGTAIVWGESIPEGGPRLKARIGNHSYELAFGPHEWSIATTPSGGCVVAWHAFNGAVEAVTAQIFDGDGIAVTGPMTLGATDMKLGAVAVSPVNGDMAVVGVLATADPFVFEVRAFRFAAGGNALGPEVVLGSARSASSDFVTGIMPDAEFDFAGNLYVAWADQHSFNHGIYARALDGAGNPLGPAVQLSSDTPTQSVRTARIPDGRFVNSWTAVQAAWGQIVSLCVPGSSVCGDGVLNPMCERCDAGIGNDDAAPDACRTNCLPAHCGDGATDAGEQCDDGNFDACDGCNALCQIEPGVVCGDAVTSALCGEQCDDGNATLLDGCTPACDWERTPGGGGPTTDCLTAWSIDNPTNVPPYDKRGRITGRQRCVDNDARCDFDGGVPGSCTFHVRACANNTDLAGCAGASRLSNWLVERPSEKQAAGKPALMDVRTALGSVPGAIIGPTTRDICSSELALVLPLRGGSDGYKPAKLKIQTRATSYEGLIDKDKLTLECVPAS